MNTRNYFHLGDRFGFFVDSVSEHIELQKGKIGKFLLGIFFFQKKYYNLVKDGINKNHGFFTKSGTM